MSANQTVTNTEGRGATSIPGSIVVAVAGLFIEY
jgi:hypothetical protein